MSANNECNKHTTQSRPDILERIGVNKDVPITNAFADFMIPYLDLSIRLAILSRLGYKFYRPISISEANKKIEEHFASRNQSSET